MLNKKHVFNIVYAVALIGAIMACFGIFNEFLQVLQLKGVMVENFIIYDKRNFWISFIYFLTAFLLGSTSVVLILLHFKFPQRIKLNMFLIIAIAVLFAMSMLGVCFFSPVIRQGYALRHPWLDYGNYMIIYTLRSTAMTLISCLGTILGCNIINEKYCKKAATEQADGKNED